MKCFIVNNSLPLLANWMSQVSEQYPLNASQGWIPINFIIKTIL